MNNKGNYLNIVQQNNQNRNNFQPNANQNNIGFNNNNGLQFNNLQQPVKPNIEQQQQPYQFQQQQYYLPQYQYQNVQNNQNNFAMNSNDAARQNNILKNQDNQFNNPNPLQANQQNNNYLPPNLLQQKPFMHQPQFQQNNQNNFQGQKNNQYQNPMNGNSPIDLPINNLNNQRDFLPQNFNQNQNQNFIDNKQIFQQKSILTPLAQDYQQNNQQKNQLSQPQQEDNLYQTNINQEQNEGSKQILPNDNSKPSFYANINQQYPTSFSDQNYMKKMLDQTSDEKNQNRFLSEQDQSYNQVDKPQKDTKKLIETPTNNNSSSSHKNNLEPVKIFHQEQQSSSQNKINNQLNNNAVEINEKKEQVCVSQEEWDNQYTKVKIHGGVLIPIPNFVDSKLVEEFKNISEKLCQHVQQYLENKNQTEQFNLKFKESFSKLNKKFIKEKKQQNQKVENDKNKNTEQPVIQKLLHETNQSRQNKGNQQDNKLKQQSQPKKQENDKNKEAKINQKIKEYKKKEEAEKQIPNLNAVKPDQNQINSQPQNNLLNQHVYMQNQNFFKKIQPDQKSDYSSISSKSQNNNQMVSVVNVLQPNNELNQKDSQVLLQTLLSLVKQVKEHQLLKIYLKEKQKNRYKYIYFENELNSPVDIEFQAYLSKLSSCSFHKKKQQSNVQINSIKVTGQNFNFKVQDNLIIAMVSQILKQKICNQVQEQAEDFILKEIQHTKINKYNLDLQLKRYLFLYFLTNILSDKAKLNEDFIDQIFKYEAICYIFAEHIKNKAERKNKDSQSSLKQQIADSNDTSFIIINPYQFPQDIEKIISNSKNLTETYICYDKIRKAALCINTLPDVLLSQLNLKFKL